MEMPSHSQRLCLSGSIMGNLNSLSPYFRVRSSTSYIMKIIMETKIWISNI